MENKLELAAEESRSIDSEQEMPFTRQDERGHRHAQGKRSKKDVHRRADFCWEDKVGIFLAYIKEGGGRDSKERKRGMKLQNRLTSKPSHIPNPFKLPSTTGRAHTCHGLFTLIISQPRGDIRDNFLVFSDEKADAWAWTQGDTACWY